MFSVLPAFFRLHISNYSGSKEHVKCFQVFRKLWSNALSLTVKILLFLEETYKGQTLNWFSMPASFKFNNKYLPRTSFPELG